MKNSDSNIEKISTLEKYLSERDDIILEHEHKIETLQRSDFKNSTLIEEKGEEIKAILLTITHLFGIIKCIL